MSLVDGTGMLRRVGRKFRSNLQKSGHGTVAILWLVCLGLADQHGVTAGAIQFGEEGINSIYWTRAYEGGEEKDGGGAFFPRRVEEAGMVESRGLHPLREDVGLGWRADELEQIMDLWEKHGLHKEEVVELESLGNWLDMWSTTREKEIECTLKVLPNRDGIGSQAVRWLGAVILSEGLGCSLATPDLLQPQHAINMTLADFHLEAGRSGVWRNGTVYCHRTLPLKETQFNDTSYESLSNMFRCSSENWTEYFNFEAYTTSQAEESPLADTDITDITLSLEANVSLSSGNLTAEEWLPIYKARHSKMALVARSSYVPYVLLQGRMWRKGDDPVTSIPSAVRTGLSRIREAYHRFPRPGYVEIPDCGFAAGQLNVAIHIRNGDLGGGKFAHTPVVIVESISRAMAQLGYSPPVFHVFSETRSPCPDRESRVFAEFPDLLISTEQVQTCQHTPTRSEQCIFREMGGVCGAQHQPCFRADNKLDDIESGPPRAFVLHVNGPEGETIRCMASADVVVSATSSFGQLALWLSNGLKIFCLPCGRRAWRKVYGRILPFFALAEGGRQWFPVGRDTELLLSIDTLKKQLEDTCIQRNVSR